MTKASMVSLAASLFFALAALVSTRNASRSVPSASSTCVACGIMTQLRCRLGPEIFLMRDSGSNSVAPNLLKSSDGHGSKSRPTPEPALATGALGAATAPDITPLTKFCTSSWVMRPFGPEPATRPSSTPSSRANLRIDGEACASLPLTAGAAAATGQEQQPPERWQRRQLVRQQLVPAPVQRRQVLEQQRRWSRRPVPANPWQPCRRP